MDAKSAQEFCNRWLPAWSENQPEKLLDFYAPDTFYIDPAHPHGLKGQGSLRPYLTKLLARYPDWTWRAVEILPTDKGFVLKWQAQLANGIRFYGLDIVEVQSGKITRNEVYFDASVLNQP